MNIGFDLHGVCDAYPKIFSAMSHELYLGNHTIHIITGMRDEDAVLLLEKYDIYYDRIFSIVSYHFGNGTKMWQNEDKSWQMDDAIWETSKGIYAQKNSIDLHFDDDISYAKWFPNNTTFVLVPKVGFELFYKHFEIV